MDMSQSDCFTLNPLYSTKGLPVSSDIPKPQDIVMLSNFDKIWLPDVNADFGLLIGNNNPRALCPIRLCAPKMVITQLKPEWVGLSNVLTSKRKTSIVLISFLNRSLILCVLCVLTS